MTSNEVRMMADLQHRVQQLENDIAGYQAVERHLRDELQTVMNQKSTYEAAIRRHRDERGDDRCWLDDETLYKSLPEGYKPPDRDTTVEIENCHRYIVCRHHPDTKYVSPQRRIEELQAQIAHTDKMWEEFKATLAQSYTLLLEKLNAVDVFRPPLVGDQIEEIINLIESHQKTLKTVME